MITRFDPPPPVETPEGPALAHLPLDDGPKSRPMRVRLPDENGQCRAVPNPAIRLRKNWSPQRRCGKPDAVQPMIAMAQP